jgi:hypothetical protein
VKRSAYLGLVREPQGRRPLGRLKISWEDNTRIKMDISEIGWRVMDWIYLAEDRDQWRALTNRQWNVGFHKMFRNS